MLSYMKKIPSISGFKLLYPSGFDKEVDKIYNISVQTGNQPLIYWKRPRGNFSWKMAPAVKKENYYFSS